MAPPRKPDQSVKKNAAYHRARYEVDLSGVSCQTCGAPAEVRHHVDGNVFDNTPENVAPFCRSCHARLHHTKTHCVRGHPLDDQNAYVSPKGVRYCRECRRYRDRRDADKINARKREIWSLGRQLKAWAP